MPSFDGRAASLQRMLGIADGDLPGAAIHFGQRAHGGYFEHRARIWPATNDIEEHTP